MQVVRATPDGYTLMQATSSTMAINVSMSKKMPYEPLKDLVPVALLSSSPFFLVVNNDSPVKTVADLIALAKAKPNGLNYGSGGPGSMHHLSTELLQSLAGIQMTHVPYKATPPAMNDLMAGHIQVLFGDTTSTLPFIKQGTVRGARRSPPPSAAPRRRTFRRSPRRCRASNRRRGRCWSRRARTPPEVIALLNREVHAIFSDPAVIQELTAAASARRSPATPAEVQEFVKQEIVRWSDVVRRAGLEGSQ